MLVPTDKLQDIYDHIKHKVQAVDGSGSVLICSAGETDAIAGCHILMTMLQSDNIPYLMFAVRGIEEVAEKVDEVDKDTCHTVVLLNCGASDDLIGQLSLNEDPEREHMQVLVLDSHRPFSLNNVYLDGEDKDGECVEVGDIERARVLLVHDPDVDEGIPDNDTVLDAHLDDDDDEEEEEEDFGESPVQRRRIGEDGESVGVVDGEEDDREERRQRRAKRDEARKFVEEYYSGTARGPPTALLLMVLSNARVNKPDPATLWWAILGVTEQLINDDIDGHQYDKWHEALMDEAIALNSKSSAELGGSHIVSAAEFRFFLLDHWNLYHSMYYSQYVATKLELWKEHQQRSLETRNSERLGTTNKLLTLLAKMGIPLEQAEQKYLHMKHNLKIRLQEKLRESDELRLEFNLDNIVCQTFRKERKNCPPIAANQCVEICNAMLCLPQTEDEQWSDAFQRASDAVWMSANREQEWDELLREKGTRNVVQGAIRLQQAIVHKAFEICSDKDMQKYGSFTACRIVAGRDSEVLLQPAALSKLAMYVLDLDRKKYQDRKKASGGQKQVAPAHNRWVLGVENQEDATCLVVGVHATSELGYKQKNRFGKLFLDAVEHGVPECEVEPCLQGFDTNVLRITSGKFDDFVNWIVQNHPHD